MKRRSLHSDENSDVKGERSDEEERAMRRKEQGGRSEEKEGARRGKEGKGERESIFPSLNEALSIHLSI